MYAVFFTAGIYDNRDAMVGTRTQRDERLPAYQTRDMAGYFASKFAEECGDIDFAVRQLVAGKWVELEATGNDIWEDIEF